MHGVRGLRQAVVLVAVFGGVSLAVAALSSAVDDGGLRRPFAVALMFIGESHCGTGGRWCRATGPPTSAPTSDSGPDR